MPQVELTGERWTRIIIQGKSTVLEADVIDFKAERKYSGRQGVFLRSPEIIN